MRYRAIIVLLLLLIINSVYGQAEINFEQIAFNYYQDSIIQRTSNNNRGKYKVTIEDLYGHYNNLIIKDSVCSKKIDFDYLNTSNSDNLRDFSPHIDYISNKRFRQNLRGRGKYPLVFMTFSFSNRTDQHVVTVFEMYKNKDMLYHIVMDDQGKLTSTCQSTFLK